MAHRNRQAAIAWGRNQIDESTDWERLCLRFVRMCFNVDSRYETAGDAWHQAEHKHRTRDGEHVPRGVPYFWTNDGAGHVVLSIGDGRCLTNDFVRTGRINVAHIDAITERWGQTPRGWTEDVNGVRVWDPREGKPAAGWERVRLSALRPGEKNKDIEVVKRRLAKKLGPKAQDLNLDEFVDYWGDEVRPAYRKWQRRLGYEGADADGVPGEASIRALGLTPVDA
jgi:hypothetical protein